MGPSPGSLTAGLSPPLRLWWLCLDRARKAPGRAPGLAAPGSCAPLTQECGEDLPPQCSRPGPRVKLRVLSWGPGGGAGMQPCNTCLHWPAGQRPNRSPPTPSVIGPCTAHHGLQHKALSPTLAWAWRSPAAQGCPARQERSHFVFVTSSWPRTEPPGSRGEGASHQSCWGMGWSVFPGTQPFGTRSTARGEQPGPLPHTDSLASLPCLHALGTSPGRGQLSPCSLVREEGSPPLGKPKQGFNKLLPWPHASSPPPSRDPQRNSSIHIPSIMVPTCDPRE